MDTTTAPSSSSTHSTWPTSAVRSAIQAAPIHRKRGSESPGTECLNRNAYSEKPKSTDL